VWVTPLLILSRYGTRGRGRSHGVRCPIPIALVTVLSREKSLCYLFWYAPRFHLKLNRFLGSPREQNRYLPMLYMIWLIVGSCPKRCSNLTHSNRSATANESWSYTYDVGIRRSSEGLSACLTDFLPVCRCASKRQSGD